MKRNFLTVILSAVFFLGGIQALKADPKMINFDIRDEPEAMCKWLAKDVPQNVMQGECLKSFDNCKTSLIFIADIMTKNKGWYHVSGFTYRTELNDYLQSWNYFEDDHLYYNVSHLWVSFEEKYQELKKNIDKNCVPELPAPIPGGPSNGGGDNNAGGENSGANNNSGAENTPPVVPPTVSTTPSTTVMPIEPVVVSQQSDAPTKTIASGCSMGGAESAAPSFGGMAIFGFALVPAMFKRIRRK